jgi:uncharacterized protein YjiS (DUF1127 family)
MNHHLGTIVPPWANLSRAIRDNQPVRNMAEFDDHLLADIGLRRTAVFGAPAQPLHRDPSRPAADDTLPVRESILSWG